MVLNTTIYLTKNKLNEFGELNPDEEYPLKCRVISSHKGTFREEASSRYSSYALVVTTSYRQLIPYIDTLADDNTTFRYNDKMYRTDTMSFITNAVGTTKYVEMYLDEVEYEV